jgi:hypothetical protein
MKLRFAVGPLPCCSVAAAAASRRARAGRAAPTLPAEFNTQTGSASASRMVAGGCSIPGASSFPDARTILVASATARSR